MESKLGKALKLVDGGARVAEAARMVGVSRQAVYVGLKAQATHAKRQHLTCSECGAPLGDARSVAVTCSGKCRVARMRRLRSVAKADADRARAAAITAERARLGLPALPGDS